VAFRSAEQDRVDAGGSGRTFVFVSTIPLRRFSRFAVPLAAALGALAVSTGAAEAQERRDSESAAFQANRGLNIGIGPSILVPTDDGPMGGGLVLDGRYGIAAGPTVLAPGGRLSGYLISRRFVGTAMPTFRVTLPAGPLAPFLVGGVGGGWMSNPPESGVGLMAGGGLMIHFGRLLAIGAEVTYQTITNTEFQNIAIGPSISFGG
jgi:hypothetical protein